MQIVLVRGNTFSLEQLEDWKQLATAAIEPNPFYEPWNLVPAMEHFGSGCDLVTVLVYTDSENGQNQKASLTGLFPLERLSRFRGIPVKCLRLWKHSYSFLSTPLLHKNYSVETLEALFNWIEEPGESSPLFFLQNIAGDGLFHQRLVDLLHSRQTLYQVMDSHTRALYSANENAIDYSEDHVYKQSKSKQARNARSREKKLRKLGDVQVRVVSNMEENSTCIRQFLEMEQSGWKGKNNSAMASKDNDRIYFEKIAQQSLETGQSLLLGLYLDEKPIAFHWNFLSGHGSFFFKPAFDEELRRYSPGVILETENMKYLDKSPAIEWMDSCSSPDNDVLNKMWNQRRIVESIIVGTNRMPGSLVVSMLPLFRWLNRKLGR